MRKEDQHLMPQLIIKIGFPDKDYITEAENQDNNNGTIQMFYFHLLYLLYINQTSVIDITLDKYFKKKRDKDC
jgi:hypothetical protein